VLTGEKVALGLRAGSTPSGCMRMWPKAGRWAFCFLGWLYQFPITPKFADKFDTSKFADNFQFYLKK
jgi:hypothetical protein